MNIGDIARTVQLPVKTLRYYEEIGLVVPARQENGYRDYGNHDLDRLRLISRARNLGFGLDDCRTLLALHDNKTRASADVKALAKAHLKQIDQKIMELEALKQSLEPLIDACQGNDDAECAILETLVQTEKASN